MTPARLRSGIAAGCVLFLVASTQAGPASAQDCPKSDPVAQKMKEEACRAAGDEWGRFGAIAHLCGIYSCAPRTKDGGKPCRNRLECEHLCIYRPSAALGAEVTGECAAVKSPFGCITQVDGGRVVGTVCMD